MTCMCIDGNLGLHLSVMFTLLPVELCGRTYIGKICTGFALSDARRIVLNDLTTGSERRMGSVMRLAVDMAHTLTSVYKLNM